MAVLLLLFGFGSVVFEVTLAVLFKIPAGAEAFTVALIRIVVMFPGVKLPKDIVNELDRISAQDPEFTEYCG